MYAYIHIKFAIVCIEVLNLIFIYKTLLHENIYCSYIGENTCKYFINTNTILLTMQFKIV